MVALMEAQPVVWQEARAGIWSRVRMAGMRASAAWKVGKCAMPEARKAARMEVRRAAWMEALLEAQLAARTEARGVVSLEALEERKKERTVELTAAHMAVLRED